MTHLIIISFMLCQSTGPFGFETRIVSAVNVVNATSIFLAFGVLKGYTAFTAFNVNPYLIYVGHTELHETEENYHVAAVSFLSLVQN